MRTLLRWIVWLERLAILVPFWLLAQRQTAPKPVTNTSNVSEAIPSTFFGMHVAVHLTSYSTPILSPVVVGAVGKGVTTAWSYTEHSRGVYSSWGPLDQLVAFGKSHNAPVFEATELEPAWAVADRSKCRNSSQLGILFCEAPPFDLATVAVCQDPLAGVVTTDCMWKEYLTTLVNRYKSTGIQTGCTGQNPQCHGVIEMYEGWNEPTGASAGTTAQFVTLETDFLNTVKANDPSAKVCSPAFSMGSSTKYYANLMNSFFANGGPKTWDCYDFHMNEPTPEGQIADINQFKAVLRNNGIDPSAVPIYATEAGRWGGCVAISDDEEQAYAARIELLYWSNGVKRHYWYAYDTCGTLTNQPLSSTLRPVGIAYGNVESWMVGATLSMPCSPTGTLWTCGFTRSSPSGYRAMAVWNSAATSSYVPSKQYTKYWDLNGNTYSISGSVTISQKPILFTNQ
jgi:hypothetical protein